MFSTELKNKKINRIKNQTKFGKLTVKINKTTIVMLNTYGVYIK